MLFGFFFDSLIGATIISIGFYTVMWGKSKEEMREECQVQSLESPPAHKTPLLQSYKNHERQSKC